MPKERDHGQHPHPPGVIDIPGADAVIAAAEARAAETGARVVIAVVDPSGELLALRPLQGGMPIVHDGEVVGAIGVSGASSADEDQELAEIGAVAA